MVQPSRKYTLCIITKIHTHTSKTISFYLAWHDVARKFKYSAFYLLQCFNSMTAHIMSAYSVSFSLLSVFGSSLLLLLLSPFLYTFEFEIIRPHLSIVVQCVCMCLIWSLCIFICLLVYTLVNNTSAFSRIVCLVFENFQDSTKLLWIDSVWLCFVVASLVSSFRTSSVVFVLHHQCVYWAFTISKAIGYFIVCVCSMQRAVRAFSNFSFLFFLVLPLFGLHRMFVSLSYPLFFSKAHKFSRSKNFFQKPVCQASLW